MNRRESILDATLSLVTDRGLYDAPMSEVASIADVAIGTIYHHFKSKESLILELYVDTKGKMLQALMEGFSENSAYQEQYARFWKNIFVFFIKNPQRFQFLQQFDHSPFYLSISQEEQRQYLKPLVDFLQKGIKNGTLRNLDDEMAVEMLYGSIVAVSKAHIHNFIDVDASKLYKAMEISWLGMKVEN